MDGHLIAVEVGIESFAHQRMKLNGVALHKDRLERLNSHAVERRRAIEEHGMIADHLFEDVPHLIILALEHFLRAFDGIGMPKLLQSANDERLIQLERDLLRQTALMQLEAWTNDNHAAG